MRALFDPVFAVLLDPYQGQHRHITKGELIDRAALAECRAAGHRGRWQFGLRAACADHLQDAIHAGRQIGVL
jgi:hypothetical protein